LRTSRVGGIERAGATSAGRVGATCRSGIGDGIASARVRATVLGIAPECVLRAGVVARTVDDLCFFDRGAPDLFRSGRRLARVLARAADRRWEGLPDLRAGFF